MHGPVSAGLQVDDDVIWTGKPLQAEVLQEQVLSTGWQGVEEQVVPQQGLVRFLVTCVLHR